jgi:hypothetical protein
VEKLKAVEIRYSTEYRLYADEFAMAIQSEVERLGIRWGVRIEADTDPASRWWEPTGVHNPNSVFADDTDPIATDLWESAHDVTPLPNVDIRAYRPRKP